MNLYQQYVDALATFSSPIIIGGTKGGVPEIDVKWFGPGVGENTVTVKMIVDTGAGNTMLSGEFATQLGIDDVTLAIQQAQSTTYNTSWTSYKHLLTMQIGDLKPLSAVPVYIADKKTDYNLLGWGGVLNRLRLEIIGGMSKPRLDISELAQAAMANAQAYFRSRV